MGESSPAKLEGAPAGTQAPTTVRVARGLFLLNAVIWALIGITTLVRTADGSTSLGSVAWIISILIFANACVMLWVGVGIGKQRKRFYYLALAVLAVNIIFEVADVSAWEFPCERFDCIASIATLHHLPLERILAYMREGLKPGGVLLVLDLFEAQGLTGKLAGAVALPMNAALNLAHTGRIQEPRAVRQAWAEHGRNDVYPTIAHVRRVCDELLPGAIVRSHLLWRYSIIWRKPASGL